MKALLIIDMLEDYFGDGPLKEMRKNLTGRINTLITGARKAEIPIIWVRQEFREDLEDAFLIMKRESMKITIAGTPGCKILSEFEVADGDYVIVKKRYSAFFGTELDSLLKKLSINELILSGINTHACVRTAAVDAYQRDMDVTIVRDCVASYDKAHHDVTLEYINRSIGKVMDLDKLSL